MNYENLQRSILINLMRAFYGTSDNEVENIELTQNAQSSALEIIIFLRGLTDSNGILPDTPQLSNEEKQGFESLVHDIEVGVDSLADAISKTIEEIAKDPADLVAVQEARAQIFSELNLLHNLIDQAKSIRAACTPFIPLYSGIRDPQLLILSLEQLGLTVATEADIRGVNNRKVKADIVVVLEGECDIGWLRDRSNSFTLIQWQRCDCRHLTPSASLGLSEKLGDTEHSRNYSSSSVRAADRVYKGVCLPSSIALLRQ